MPPQHVENTKEFWSESESKRANKHANKRIIYWLPFWNKVYVILLTYRICSWVNFLSHTSSEQSEFCHVNLNSRKVNRAENDFSPFTGYESLHNLPFFQSNIWQIGPDHNILTHKTLKITQDVLVRYSVITCDHCVIGLMFWKFGWIMSYDQLLFTAELSS